MIARRDVADHLHRRLVLDLAHRIGAVGQHFGGILGEKADELLAPGRLQNDCSSERLPMKSAFFFDTRPSSPTSIGVTVPSVSSPTTM